MENINLKIARQNYEQSNFIKAKKHYDLYIKELNSNLDLNELSEFQEISNEYINTIEKVLNLNISESSPLFKKFDETKTIIQNKFEIDETLSEYEENVRKLLLYKMFYTVHWGNYEDMEIISIILKDPEYILWCIINLEHFAIDKSIFLIESIQKEPQYLTALEINSIKCLIIEKWGTDNDDFDRDSNYNTYDSYDDYNDYDDFTHPDDSPYYNDNLDMDQQSPEFWDSL